MGAVVSTVNPAQKNSVSASECDDTNSCRGRLKVDHNDTNTCRGRLKVDHNGTPCNYNDEVSIQDSFLKNDAEDRINQDSFLKNDAKVSILISSTDNIFVDIPVRECDDTNTYRGRLQVDNGYKSAHLKVGNKSDINHNDSPCNYNNNDKPCPKNYASTNMVHNKIDNMRKGPKVFTDIDSNNNLIIKKHEHNPPTKNKKL